MLKRESQIKKRKEETTKPATKGFLALKKHKPITMKVDRKGLYNDINKLKQNIERLEDEIRRKEKENLKPEGERKKEL